MTRNPLLPVPRDLGFEMEPRDEKNWGSSILVPAPRTGEDQGLLHLSGGSRRFNLPYRTDQLYLYTRFVIRKNVLARVRARSYQLKPPWSLEKVLDSR